MITKKMAKSLNEQLNHEFYSAYLYLSMSAYCSKMDFNGAASWFLLQYHEEQSENPQVYCISATGLNLSLYSLWILFHLNKSSPPS